jgi:glycogen operon protein
VGSFPAYGRWAEWNGRFRDCIRKFLKGDEGQAGEMASRLAGSHDMYHDRGSSASINFVTCHDGFTLADLVSYNHKHNEANGEDNRDGANDNHSWNCGSEGPTDNAAINALRRQQMKNALAMLLLSRGVPMLLMGDECGRTQQGNNNAYCHDGPLTWYDWSLLKTNADLFRFCRLMIRFRQQQPWPAGAMDDSLELSWHGTRPWHPDWSASSRVLAFMRRGNDHGDLIYAMMNMYWEPLEFELPALSEGRRWLMFANTGMPTPEDIWESGQEPVLSDQKKILAAGRSIIVLVTRYGSVDILVRDAHVD